MKNPASPEKYLAVLRQLNSVRRATYQRMTKSLDKRLQKLFSKFTMDSMANVKELDLLINQSSREKARLKHSFLPTGIMVSLVKGSETIFDQCREAEWRLLRFYEEVMNDPRTSKHLAAMLAPQREKVLRGYEHLNLLSKHPW